MYERIVGNKLKGEPWHRLFNPLIMEVFREYNEDGGVLFGVTGDLDNLGVYVARNGRPSAENLVDFYNQVIRNYLQQWVVEHNNLLRSVAFVPSGEEITLVGIAKDQKLPQQLFYTIGNGVMKLVKEQHHIDIGDTAASFGGVVFNDKYKSEIEIMVEKLQNHGSDEIVYPVYLETMKRIREDLAVALDTQKFKDILDGNFPVEMRQLVLSRMLLYKRTTKQIIMSLGSLSPAEISQVLEMVGNIYGIKKGKEDEIDRLFESLNIKQY
jgi:hypothetical protein